MATWLQAFAVFLGTLQSQATAEGVCDAESLQHMQEGYSNCTAELIYQFQDTKHNFPGETYVEEAACILVQKILSQCGEVWRKCHSEAEVSMMGAQYVERILAQYSDVKMDHCKQVKELGAKANHIHEVVTCSDDEINSMRMKYTECSDSAARSAHTQLVSADSLADSLVSAVLCGALREVAEECSRTLGQCYTKEDLNTTMQANIRDMKQFLGRLAGDTVHVSELDNCLRKTEETVKDTTIGPLELTKGTQQFSSEEKSKNASFASENNTKDIVDIEKEIKDSSTQKLQRSEEATVRVEEQMSQKLTSETSSGNLSNFFNLYLTLFIAFLFVLA